ncbi:hypothetical protein Tco_0139079 [Tanacetum coccineum]
MNELNEIYKEKTKKIHDSKIKNRIFNVGDRVLLFNSRLKIFSGKLKTRWTGPFTIAQVFPYGAVELSQTTDPNIQEIPSGESKNDTLAILRPVIGGLDVASNQGSRSIAWRIIKIEGPGIVDEERPRVLDPSPHHYIRRPPHSLPGI